MTRELIIVLAAVLAAHYAYYLWPAGSRDSRWAQYVFQGGSFALLCLAVALLARRLSGEVGAPLIAVCAWGALEGLMQFGCGLALWGSTPRADLCVELAGPWPFVLVATVAVAWLMTRRHRG